MACWCARRSCDLISLPGLLNVLGLLVFLLCCFLLDCLYWKVGCIRRFLLGRVGKVLTRRGLRGRRILMGIYIYIYIYICVYIYIIYKYITYLALKTMIVQHHIKHINTIGFDIILYSLFSGLAMLYIYIIYTNIYMYT